MDATEVEDAVEDATPLEDAPCQPAELRFATPERKPAQTRTSDESMPVPPEKMRRLDPEAMEADDDEGNGIDIDTLDSQDLLMLSQIIRGADIVEIYSPERVNRLATKFGLTPGASMDLTNGFDFDKIEDQERAWKSIRESKPTVVIGSPPCTYFSLLQELNIATHGKDAEWMRKFKEHRRKAIRHIELLQSVPIPAYSTATLSARAPMGGTKLEATMYRRFAQRPEGDGSSNAHVQIRDGEPDWERC